MSPHLSEQMFATQADPALQAGSTRPAGSGPAARRLRRSLPEFEVLEAFSDGKSLTRGHLAGALPDRLLRLGPLANLALVSAQPLDLESGGFADFTPAVG